MIFRQLIDLQTSTFTYLVADEASRECVLIDSVFEQHLRDRALLRELSLKLAYCFETHVHADHVTGAWRLREATGCKIAVAAAAGTTGADCLLEHGHTIQLGQLCFEVRATPGHTDGCVSYMLEKQGVAFTGDALLIRGAGRTDFQQGCPHRLFQSVRQELLSLPDETKLYPAHDYRGRLMTTVGEEKQHNPRLGDGVREQDFVGYMNHLGLPHPKRIDHAVPANMRCGEPSADYESDVPTWAPLTRTFAGIWEVDVEWVFRHGSEVLLLDVREREEIAASSMGSVAGARCFPLSRLRKEMAGLPTERPMVVICPAGARSASAASILEKAGFDRIANMQGGLLEWRAAGLPLVAIEAEA